MNPNQTKNEPRENSKVTMKLHYNLLNSTICHFQQTTCDILEVKVQPTVPERGFQMLRKSI